LGTRLRVTHCASSSPTARWRASRSITRSVVTAAFREVGTDPNARPGNADQYYVAPVGQDAYAVSYLAGSGYTLTAVLDFKTLKLVAFASKEKSLVMQQGTFELLGSAAR
jgi:hypothetical protein